jgi:hypothetical protein
VPPARRRSGGRDPPFEGRIPQRRCGGAVGFAGFLLCAVGGEGLQQLEGLDGVGHDQQRLGAALVLGLGVAQGGQDGGVEGDGGVGADHRRRTGAHVQRLLPVVVLTGPAWRTPARPRHVRPGRCVRGRPRPPCRPPGLEPRPAQPAVGVAHRLTVDGAGGPGAECSRVCWATWRAWDTGTSPAHTRAHNRGSRCRTSSASAISACPARGLVPIRAPNCATANSHTLGVPAPPSRTGLPIPGSTRPPRPGWESGLCRSAKPAAAGKIRPSASPGPHARSPPRRAPARRRVRRPARGP